MKKQFCLVLALLLLLSLCACGGKTEQAQGGSGGGQGGGAAPAPTSASGGGQGAQAPATEAPGKPSSGGAGSSSPSSLPGMNVKLTKLTALSGSDFKGDEYIFRDHGIAAVGPEGKTVLLDRLGNVLDLGTYDGIDERYGLFMIYKEDAFPNPWGLVSSDGGVLIPCEAAGFDRAGGGDRYIQVYFTTEKVESQEDALIFFTDSQFAALFPDEDDLLYDGYYQVYDLQEKRYVSGVQGDSYADLRQVGDCFCLDSIRQKWLYDASGRLLADEGTFYDGFIVGEKNDDGKYPLYDFDMKLVAELPFWPCEVADEGRAFVVDEHELAGSGDYGYYFIVDKDGKKLSELRFRYAADFYGGYFYGKDESGNYAVLDRLGNVVVPFEEGVSFVDEMGFGFLRLNKPDGNWLLYPDGSEAFLGAWEDIYCDGVAIGWHLGRNKDTGHYEYRALILETGEYGEIFTNLDSLCEDYPLFAVRDGDSDYAILNAVNGAILTEFIYETVEYSGGCLYCFDGENWDVFEISMD